MRPALQKIIEQQIKEAYNKADALAYEIKKEADRAQAEIENNPENAPNVYSRYVSAAQKKIAEGKKKTAEVTADKKANVAITQQDSIFKDIKLPGGISTKATEYKNLAATGDKWETAVFGIGSAKESTNIPKPSPVTRKPHSTTQASLRDPSQSNLGNAGRNAGYDTGYSSPDYNTGNNGSYTIGQPPLSYNNGGYNGGVGLNGAQQKTAGTVPPANLPTNTGAY